MRESIGGAWLFGIVIVFIFFFSAFLAYSISYTKAFNVKNSIISIIEQNEGFNSAGTNDLASLSDEELEKSAEGKAFKLIRNAGYNYSGTQGITCEGNIQGNPNPINKGGYCLVKYCPNTSLPNANTHYKVTTYIALNLPIINVTVKIPISGETRSIYTDPWPYPCTDGVL